MNYAKCVIFVDGSNLLGSLKKLNLQVNDYDAFFHYIFNDVLKQWKHSFSEHGLAAAQLSRTMWYEVGSMDEWDLSLPSCASYLKDSFGKDSNLKRAYMAIAGEKKKGLNQQQLFDTAWDICFEEAKKWYSERKDKLDGIKRFHYAVSSDTDFIDIVESGHWKVDILNKFVSEKGLDTSLAVDMIALMNNYDIAILVSGDADAIPSLHHIKRAGKHVCVVEFIKGIPPEKKGRQSSSKLKMVADFVSQIYEMDLIKEGLGKRPEENAAVH